MPTLQEALARKQEALAEKGLALEKSGTQRSNLAQTSDYDADEVPRMYRAQIGGRCDLQYIDSNKRRQNTQQESDLDVWLREWLYPGLSHNQSIPELNHSPTYCSKAVSIKDDGSIYRIQIDFPFRLFSNCGQDSINRPVMGKRGIPFLPGSSVKGLFRRACNSPEQLKKYCGDKTDLTPGTSSLRFHGAYPIGNWGKRIRDVVHPQENRQVGGPEKKHESAHPLISLYKPQLVFEFSAPKTSTVDWQEVEQILLRAIALGVGGKTSVSYGTSGHLPEQTATAPNFGNSHRQFRFIGDALSPKLLTGESEFRPNLFKATLRSHARRLLAGALGTPGPIRRGAAPMNLMEAEVDRLFGHTDSPGVVQIVWQPTQAPNDEHGEATYHTEGILHLGVDANHPQAKQGDMQFITQLLRFAYIMGGFGKSWRRIWHHTFYPSYYRQGHSKFPIGCHWVSPDIEAVATPEDLGTFLSTLHQSCCQQLGSRATQPEKWRESWHPERVAVFYCLTDSSQAVHLFHDDIFKTTPAIGGKKPGERRPTGVSSVWHRMLPLLEGNYLEILTIFHGDRKPWKRNGEDQLMHFIDALEDFEHVWGTEPK